MVEQVEDGAAGTQCQSLIPEVHRERPGYLQVRRRKLGKPPNVACSDVVPVFVLDGIWKTRMQVIDRRNGQLPWTRNIGRKQEAVWSVKKQTRLGVRLNHCLRIVADEQEEDRSGRRKRASAHTMHSQ